ncbi:MAG: PCRF domain-containing protein, partial [Betaproteobacteria bacterium]|nr:PCRF domain-containing protein [Betaproteobacteria bacterium]
VDIQFGAGGDESQDWARMLVRMYTGYAASRGWKVSIIEETPGDHGIKSCSLLLEGVNAYGYLRTETGIHRMVRKSPFDSNHRRHTTFASVFVYPVLESDSQVQINPADLRIDTYRASGAGGQHVNTTDSAVRITHNPSGIVVQCQNDRSQHKNRATALAMLQSRLEMLAEEQAQAHKRQLAASKDDIGWGSQIRSYVLDQSRVKDLRTGHESGNPNAVLDGSALGRFIEASLRSKV